MSNAVFELTVFHAEVRYSAAVRTGVLLSMLVPFVCAGLASGSSPDSVRDALGLYARGEHAAAVALNPKTLRIGVLTGTADAWIREGAADDRSRRRIVAAALVLDIVWAATRHADNAFSDPRDCAPPALLDDVPVASCRAIPAAVAWACAMMSQPGTAHPATEWWWRISVGLLEDARAWAELAGTPRRGQQPFDPHVLREVKEGHLSHVEAHVPGDPRWRLSRMLALAALDSRPAIQWPIRADVLRDATLAAPGRTGRTERELAELAKKVPDLAGEIELHLAWREMQRRRWREALPLLERAERLSIEPLLQATAAYFAGYAYERLNRPVDALEAYGRAHGHAPLVRNIGVLYSAQLFLDNRRDDAHAVLEALAGAPEEPVDLRTRLERGSARLVPEYIARMREALR
jgi:tetratricopeptide (TPR) repeat protein